MVCGVCRFHSVIFQEECKCLQIEFPRVCNNSRPGNHELCTCSPPNLIRQVSKPRPQKHVPQFCDYDAISELLNGEYLIQGAIDNLQTKYESMMVRHSRASSRILETTLSKPNTNNVDPCSSASDKLPVEPEHERSVTLGRAHCQAYYISNLSYALVRQRLQIKKLEKRACQQVGGPCCR